MYSLKNFFRLTHRIRMNVYFLKFDVEMGVLPTGYAKVEIKPISS